MANQFLTAGWVSLEVLKFLLNGLEIAQYFSTNYDKEFHKDFAVGSSAQIKLPQRFLIRDGLGYNPQGINRISTTVNLDQIFGIDFEWDSYEKAVFMERSEEELRAQYLMPAAKQLANELDSRAALWAYQNTNNAFGVLGTDPTTPNIFLNAEKRLFEKSCPEGKRGLITSPTMQASLVPNFTTFFNPQGEIAKQYKTGLMGTAFGWEWYRSNNVFQHTAGTWAGAVTVTGSNQTGSSLIITGTNGDTVKKGDMFSILNVNFVNPMSRRVSGATQPQMFVVTQDQTLTGGSDTIQISPAIFGPGSQYQNVDALPVGGAALTLWLGTPTPNGKVGTQCLGLSEYAFLIAGAKFEMPKAVEVSSQTKDPQTGLSVRFIRQFDAVQSKMINRFDMCVGFGNAYPDNGAVRLVGA